jgi:uncharacterized membrane protein
VAENTKSAAVRSRRRGKHLFLLVLVAACSSDRGADGNGVPSQVIHGFALFGHEVRSFRPCDTQAPLWTVDSTGLLWRVTQELTSDSPPDRELYALLEGRLGPPPTEGFGVGYSGTLVVERVLHVASEGDRCDQSPPGLLFWASGNEPFWSASVSPEGLEVRRLGEETRAWAGPRIEEDELGASVTVAGGESTRGRDTARLVLKVDPCRDSMSGAYFEMSAQMILGSDTLSGCAFGPGGRSEGLPDSGDGSGRTGA